MDVSFTDKFHIEQMQRAVNNCESIEEVKSLANNLIIAWHSQKAATLYFMNEHLISQKQLNDYLVRPNV